MISIDLTNKRSLNCIIISNLEEIINESIVYSEVENLFQVTLKVTAIKKRDIYPAFFLKL